MSQFNTIKIYTVFTQQKDSDSIQIPIDYKLGDAGTDPGTESKGQKFPWSNGIEIIHSLLPYQVVYVF